MVKTFWENIHTAKVSIQCFTFRRNIKSLTMFSDGAQRLQKWLALQDRAAETPYGDGSTLRSRYSFSGKAGGLTSADGEPLSPAQTLVHFLDNHDVPRWLYDFPGKFERYRNALTFLLTTDGIPCIYYGTEQDFAGGPDPSNREDMWLSDFSTEKVTFKHLQRLISIRKELPALRRGNLEFLLTSDQASSVQGVGAQAGILAFSRTYREQKVLVILNTHDDRDSQTVDLDGTPMSTGLPPNTQLVDLLSGNEFQVDANGGLNLTINANTALILKPGSVNARLFAHNCVLGELHMKSSNQFTTPEYHSCRHHAIGCRC